MFLHNLHFQNFIPDIVNLIFMLITIIYISIKYQIKFFFLINLSVFLFTPFLFYFLFPWTLFPDQSKYADTVYNFRNLSFEYSLFEFLTSKVDFTSLILALFPVPFISTIISVSLINKGILYVIILYFLKKKKYFLVNLLFFLPSIIFFSSVALKEILVIGLAIAFFYYFLEKKNYFKSFFFATLLILVKPFFGFMCLTIAFGYYIFFVKLNLNLINKISFKSFIVFIVLTVFFLTALFFLQDLLIVLREGFFSEEYGYQLLLRKEDITISVILKTFIQFLFSPLSMKDIYSWAIIIFIENLFLIFVVIILLKKIYKENQCKAIFWIITFLFLFMISGFILFNAGTIWRYKFVAQIVMISAMYFSLKNNKQINLS